MRKSFIKSTVTLLLLVIFYLGSTPVIFAGGDEGQDHTAVVPKKRQVVPKKRQPKAKCPQQKCCPTYNDTKLREEIKTEIGEVKTAVEEMGKKVENPNFFKPIIDSINSLKESFPTGIKESLDKINNNLWWIFWALVIGFILVCLLLLIRVLQGATTNGLLSRLTNGFDGFRSDFGYRPKNGPTFWDECRQTLGIQNPNTALVPTQPVAPGNKTTPGNPPTT